MKPQVHYRSQRERAPLAFVKEGSSMKAQLAARRHGALPVISALPALPRFRPTSLAPRRRREPCCSPMWTRGALQLRAVAASAQLVASGGSTPSPASMPPPRRSGWGWVLDMLATVLLVGVQVAGYVLAEQGAIARHWALVAAVPSTLWWLIQLATRMEVRCAAGRLWLLCVGVLIRHARVGPSTSCRGSGACSRPSPTHIRVNHSLCRRCYKGWARFKQPWRGSVKRRRHVPKRHPHPLLALPRVVE